MKKIYTTKIKNFLRNQNNILRTKRQRQDSWPFPRRPAKGGEKKITTEEEQDK